MEPQELARWTRFASKGGIGRCTALRDRIAQDNDELMFLQVSRNDLCQGTGLTLATGR